MRKHTETWASLAQSPREAGLTTGEQTKRRPPCPASALERGHKWQGQGRPSAHPAATTRDSSKQAPRRHSKLIEKHGPDSPAFTSRHTSPNSLPPSRSEPREGKTLCCGGERGPEPAHLGRQPPRLATSVHTKSKRKRHWNNHFLFVAVHEDPRSTANHKFRVSLRP